MKKLQWINTAAFGSMLLVNLLANLIPFGGRTTGQVSALYPNLFTPAPITFSIWGLIYGLMALFVLYQWEVFDGGEKSAGVRKAIGPWFAVSCAFNIIWLLCWHFNAIGLSLLAMVSLMVCLLLIELILDDFELGMKGWLTAKAGFDICLGWLTAAAIANTAVLLVKLRWNGWGLPAELWTMIALMGGTLIACLLILYSNMPIAAVSLIWAYTGILIRHFSTGGYAGSYPFVIAGAIIGITAIISAYAIELYRRDLQRKARAVIK